MSYEYDPIRGMHDRNETRGCFIEEQFLVPDKMVGKIIGLCGEQIHSLQMETGCKIQLDPLTNDIHHRICTLIGSVESVKAAKTKIEEIINRYSNDSFQSGNVPGGQFVEEMMIPGLQVALLIGKGGENIKSLQEGCGVKMAIIQDGPEQSIYDKPLRISGDPDNVKIAKQMVKDFLACNEMFSVPLDKCGLVIGKGGKMIRNITQQSGARVDKARELPSYVNEQTFIIRGNPKQIEHAKNLMREVCNMDGSEDKYPTSNQEVVSSNLRMSSSQEYNFNWIVFVLIIAIILWALEG